MDVFVFNDESFEVTEQFTGQVDGFLNADGAQVPSLNGVTVNPDQTRILILDQDSKLELKWPGSQNCVCTDNCCCRKCMLLK